MNRAKRFYWLLCDLWLVLTRRSPSRLVFWTDDGTVMFSFDDSKTWRITQLPYQLIVFLWKARWSTFLRYF